MDPIEPRLGVFDDQPDAIIDGVAFEILVQMRDFRQLRASIMSLARRANEEGQPTALVLDDPRMTDERLTKEWESLYAVLDPRLHSKISLIVYRDGLRVWGSSGPYFSYLANADLGDAIQRKRIIVASRRRRSSEVFYDILRILIHQWSVQAGPQTSRALADMAGCTYPTVASSLARLRMYLTRHSDRKVELNGFPHEFWLRLVANAKTVRETVEYADASGQPRSIELLMQKFSRLKLAHVAIGGAAGVRRLFPGLDLVGEPRLDLTVQCLGQDQDLRFVQQLDPALKRIRYDDGPVRVAVHFLRRPEVFFHADSKGVQWSDLVECLLDLHEMRLESQVHEIISSLPLRANAKS